MLKKLLVALSTLASFTAFAEEIVLTKKNTVVFNEVFNPVSVAKAQAELMKLDATLSKRQPIYLYLNTPGGSIDAGVSLIRFAKSLDHEVKTITSFSASMGFFTVQQLGERLILEEGTLMAHRAYISLEGQVPGEFNVRSTFFYNFLDRLENQIAVRLKTDLNTYRSKVVNEWWVNGTEAVELGLADRVVTAKCGKDMSGTVTKEVNFLFFTVKVTFSECPLIEGPIAIGDIDGSLAKLYPLETAQAQRIINELYYDKVAFVKNYIITRKYQELFK